MTSVQTGATRAIDECKFQFRTRRWNCSSLDDDDDVRQPAIVALPSSSSSSSSSSSAKLLKKSNNKKKKMKNGRKISTTFQSLLAASVCKWGSGSIIGGLLLLFFFRKWRRVRQLDAKWWTVQSHAPQEEIGAVRTQSHCTRYHFLLLFWIYGARVVAMVTIALLNSFECLIGVYYMVFKNAGGGRESGDVGPGTSFLLWWGDG